MSSVDFKITNSERSNIKSGCLAVISMPYYKLSQLKITAIPPSPMPGTRLPKKVIILSINVPYHCTNNGIMNYTSPYLHKLACINNIF